MFLSTVMYAEDLLCVTCALNWVHVSSEMGCAWVYCSFWFSVSSAFPLCVSVTFLSSYTFISSPSSVSSCLNPFFFSFVLVEPLFGVVLLCSVFFALICYLCFCMHGTLIKKLFLSPNQLPTSGSTSSTPHNNMVHVPNSTCMLPHLLNIIITHRCVI